MEPESYPQCRIVPIRMLQSDTAEKFLDGIACIPGIRRMLVHGPGYLDKVPCRPRDLCEIGIPAYKEVKISEQPIRMYVLMGDVIIEAFDEKVFDTVADYCTEFFDDFSFQILVGTFLKTEPSLADYLIEKKQEPELVGMSDYHQGVYPTVIRQDIPEICNT